MQNEQNTGVVLCIEFETSSIMTALDAGLPQI